MNPGYAGRTELPDNLKALLRPISMMVPDSAVIAEIMLQSEGFLESKVLAKKITTLYALMMQQLSKQDHYDFGLRAIKSVLNMAGSLKRSRPDEREQVLLRQACRSVAAFSLYSCPSLTFFCLSDMNAPKFVSEDVPLFTDLLEDLFPGVELPELDRGDLERAIAEEMQRRQLDVTSLSFSPACLSISLSF